MKKLNRFELTEGQLVDVEYLKENDFNKEIPKTNTLNYVIYRDLFFTTVYKQI